MRLQNKTYLTNFKISFYTFYMDDISIAKKAEVENIKLDIENDGLIKRYYLKNV